MDEGSAFNYANKNRREFLADYGEARTASAE
jgi:hypothetical protein